MILYTSVVEYFLNLCLALIQNQMQSMGVENQLLYSTIMKIKEKLTLLMSYVIYSLLIEKIIVGL